MNNRSLYFYAVSGHSNRISQHAHTHDMAIRFRSVGYPHWIPFPFLLVWEQSGKFKACSFSYIYTPGSGPSTLLVRFCWREKEGEREREREKPWPSCLSAKYVFDDVIPFFWDKRRCLDRFRERETANHLPFATFT